MARHCKLICQYIFRTVGDRKEGRDLNEKTLEADNGYSTPLFYIKNKMNKIKHK